MDASHTIENYWEGRGAAGFFYRGERLYTITAAPYYLARRAAVDEEIVHELQKCRASRILDFGCGDGSCMERLRPRHSAEAQWVGVDVSSTMLHQARARCPDVMFASSTKELPEGMRFDFFSAVTVFAHISDHNLPALLAEMRESLEPNASGLVFEQKAPLRHEGSQFVRRSVTDYCKIFAASDFAVSGVKILDWSVHRVFERTVAKFIYRHLCGRGVEYERRITANRSRLFRGLSRLCLRLSPGVLRDYTKPCWGYGLFRLQRTSG